MGPRKMDPPTLQVANQRFRPLVSKQVLGKSLTQIEKSSTPSFVNLHDLEQLAKQRLDQASYDFVAGGAGAELTLRANREAFQTVHIIPQFLTSIKKAD